MRILIDTNILVRVSERGHVDHRAAMDTLAALRHGRHQLCVVPQIVYEFWSVATRPIQNNGLGMNIDEAREAVVDAKASFRLLRDERAVFERWERLVVEHDVKGKRAHDARIVAAMLRHDVSHLLTFNVQDFAPFTGLTIVAPQDAFKLPAADG